MVVSVEQAAPTWSATVARLRFAQKPKAQTPAYLRFVNRRLGGYLAAAAFVRGWTPNRLTAVSAGLSLVGVVALALVRPSWWLGVLVALALLAGFAFDSADGQLARLRGGGSPVGEWLDHVVDAVKSCLLHSAVAISVYRFEPDLPGAVLLLPLVFLTAYVALAFASMLRDQLLRARGAGGSEGGSDSVLRGVLLLPVDYGTLCLAFALLGAPRVFLAVYGVLAVLNVLFDIRLLVRTFRQLSAVGSPA
ncbi:CDP-alcohol phosphatidyltransferase family protein [Kineosporia sp. J2-2]|uniref:CDP-alcohol phosphatidyltransferase family protein n=1 Tax=Kineosporia corallincola TaxID=2835133 RepID=A0ABS5THG5_9ACTN|nr:CDP-alcohol phosphatidyltransferase family protein [Kineosporia corallincola]MBT0770539.1 CDP-alcohol phosphatidyltransferase family protein [Kineosporia corallincola]